jgi:hypothetical protein
MKRDEAFYECHSWYNHAWSSNPLSKLGNVIDSLIRFKWQRGPRCVVLHPNTESPLGTRVRLSSDALVCSVQRKNFNGLLPNQRVCEVSLPREHGDDCLLGYWAVWYKLTAFRKCLLSPSSGRYSEDLWNDINFYQTTRGCISEGSNLDTDRRENLFSHKQSMEFGPLNRHSEVNGSSRLEYGKLV